MLLREGYDRIPLEIPNLSLEEAEQMVSTRLKDPRMRSAIQDMAIDDSMCEETEQFTVESEDEDDENSDGHDGGVSVAGSNDTRRGACRGR